METTYDAWAAGKAQGERDAAKDEWLDWLLVMLREFNKPRDAQFIAGYITGMADRLRELGK